MSNVSTVGNNANAGGLAGYGSDIHNSYATGNVSTAGGGAYAGGLVGWGRNNIHNSYATGNVSTAGGGAYAGGLAGNGSNVHNSYATGSVFTIGESANAGGLVGYGRGIHNSYVNNEVSATGQGSAQGGIAGYLFANSYYPSTNSFFNQDKNPDLDAIGSYGDYTDIAHITNLSGKKDADLKKRATFTGWDFDTVWRIKEDGSEYPYLRALTQGTIIIDPIDPSEPKGDLGVQAHALNKTYDAKAVATVDDLRAIAQANGYKDIVSITGLKDGDSLDSLGKLSYGGTWQNAKNAGKYSIIPTGLNGGQKYEIKYGEGSLTINKRPLTITANKEYDGTVSAKVYGDDDIINVPQIISLNNKILGDDVSILAGTSGVLSHKNHGWRNLVDLGNLVLTGRDSNNYVLTKEGSGWEISKKRVRLTGERQYDGSAWVNGGDLVIDNRDIINGDELILNRYSGDVKVDGYTVNSSNKPRKIVSTEKIKLDGKDSGNYIIDKNRSYINIIPRYISVDVSKEYDGSNIFTKGFKIGNIVDGDKVDAYISRATVSGKDNISDGIDYDKFTSISIGINNPNYKFDMDNSRVSAIINPKIVEIIPLGDFEKYYYQNMNKFNFNHEEIVSGDKVKGYLIPYINKDGTSVIGDDIKYIDVGKYDMNFSLSKILVDNSKNYTLFIKPKKFEVKPLPLTVKANDQEYRPKWYNPAQGVTALAFFNSKDYQIIIPNNGLEYPREIEHYGELGILNGRDLQLVTPKPGDYQILPSQNFKFPNYDVNFKKGVYRVYASEYIPVVSHIRGLAYVVEGAGMQVGEEALGKVESTVGAITTYAQNIYDNFDWDNHPYASVALVVVGSLAIVGEGASHLLSSAPDMVVLMVKGVGVFAIEESESWTDDEKGEYANHFRDVVDVLKIFWDIKEMKEMVGSDLSSRRLKKELYDSLVANKGFTGVEARQYVKYLDDKGIIDAMLSDAAGEIFWNATSLTRDAIQFIVNSTGKPVEKINNRGSYDK